MFSMSLLFLFFYSIIKMFTQNKEDRKRVEKALDIASLPSGKVNDLIISACACERLCFLLNFMLNALRILWR